MDIESLKSQNTALDAKSFQFQLALLFRLATMSFLCPVLGSSTPQLIPVSAPTNSKEPDCTPNKLEQNGQMQNAVTLLRTTSSQTEIAVGEKSNQTEVGVNNEAFSQNPGTIAQFSRIPHEATIQDEMEDNEAAACSLSIPVHRAEDQGSSSSQSSEAVEVSFDVP